MIDRAAEAYTLEMDGHEVTVVPPDHVHLKLRGQITPAHVRRFTASEHSIWPGTERIYTLVDMRAVSSLSPRTMQAILEEYRPGPPRSVAVVMASGFTLRTMIEAVIRALRVFGREPELAFFPDEEAARRWLEERRTQKNAPKRTPTPPVA